MERTEVYALIDQERAYQDKTFDPDELLDSGLTRRQRDSEVLPHIELLRDYAHEAGMDWTYSHKRGHKSGSLEAVRAIAKIAAIAVRALERMPVAETLKWRGLR